MKNLVIYYSRKGQNYVNGTIQSLSKGNAEVIAEDIQKAVGADLFEVETVKPYSIDYKECIQEASKELHEHARPQLKEMLKDISGYDNIFIVGPCWWGTYPMAMFTCLEGLDFNGKKVFACMTHEGSGMGSSEKDLQDSLKGAIFGKSLAVAGHSVHQSETMISNWASKSIAE
jgi:flavodoxin